MSGIETLMVTLFFEKRDDGGLCVYSNDVPGLVISSKDHHAVFADLGPALEELLKPIIGDEGIWLKSHK